MGNDDVLIPGKVLDVEEIPSAPIPEEYLKIVNALSEIANRGEGAKQTARENLLVYSQEDVQQLITEKANELHHHLTDLLQSLSAIVNDNKSSSDESYDQLTSLLETLSTKQENNALKLYLIDYITNTLKAYLTSTLIDDRIVQSLLGYAENSLVYKRDELYTKREIDKNYVKKDGSTPFTSTLAGVYPKFRKDLATKGYADDCMKNHKNEADPHNFISKVSDKLKNYVTRSEVWTKAYTYSRDDIDRLTERLVREACGSLINEHINITPHLTSLDISRIIKNYAKEYLLEKDDFDKTLLQLKEETQEKIDQVSPVWKTSGAVLTTVGFVEDNTELDAEMSMQDILDLIFYGPKVSIQVDEKVGMGETTDVTVCVHGGISTDSILVYLGEEILRELSDSDFEDGCVTFESNPVTEDTEFRIEVIYSNGVTADASATVEVVAPVFIGLLPVWKHAHTLTRDYIENDLIGPDPENNKFIINYDGAISHYYNFKDVQFRHLFIMVPISNSNLDNITIASLKFGIEAFDIVDQIPNIKENVLYKVYVYEQPLSSLNQEVTFNFE